ncbi:SDR family oxidoreductase [Poseidonibacter lekithochrous]|uniref:SDR family oxidoreductase n=1 Tax=Poseidonibacter TaxID=2321187 RepID=UPI001C09FD05|nr:MULTISPECIES: SDR family oxidoreductase [Poseidonibacter]MBU3015759.1 SDR family oxidoreductase [Poseidonibacter lekithochrous]MDO6829059.1 SDR family oxidoreductase [Poseidonibacter sp. 1_MG-2023]
MNYKKIQQILKEKPKTWLVTGCAGFIGSNLVETLLTLNQKVLGLDNFATGHQYNLDHIEKSVSKEQWENFSFTKGDISDYETCINATKGVDVVLNQAALGSVPRSIDNPVISNNSNVTGFLNMLTAAKENGVKRFVYASSSSVYGDSEELPKVESRTGNLLSPYAVTKYVNELYMGVFYKCYGFESIGLRYFNVFGKRQDPNGAYAAVMPKWISQMLNGEDVYINGDGETSRDFTYIDNVVQANIMAGTTTNTEAFAKAYNTAAGGRETLNNLFNAIATGLKEKLPELEVQEPIYRDFRAGDIRHSNANIDQAKELLGYEPTHNLEEGLKESLEWYINDIKGNK